ncbi:MAG: hypothetical protein ACR2FI_07775 [Burkholderiales bacterium]|nr:hypothetical protein [Burkholderiales bacterium]MDQ3196676.1 hypothetical protein [Pseudomonadota bacterium]
MLRIKAPMLAVVMLGLMTTSIASFAGRYGEAEIRHSHAIAKKHETQSAQMADCFAGQLGERAARQSGGAYQKSPFRKNSAG